MQVTPIRVHFTRCELLYSFLNALWGLSADVMVVAEQDSNRNGSTPMERLLESLYYYVALFDCVESTLPRTSVERLKLEKSLLSEEIKNIIACEGTERKDRHEKLENWIQRLVMAMYVPLSYHGVHAAVKKNVATLQL